MRVDDGLATGAPCWRRFRRRALGRMRQGEPIGPATGDPQRVAIAVGGTTISAALERQAAELVHAQLRPVYTRRADLRLERLALT